MTGVTIGVVVTTFRTGALTEETVGSLLDQTRPPERVVVVDDASPDRETREMLDRVAALPTVTVLRQPVNRGVSAARNRGIDALDTDLITLIDGDDLFEANAIAEFARALDRAPGAAFAYPSVAAFGNRADLFEAPEYNLYALHMVNLCPIASTVRREVFAAGLRFADGVNPEDWDFWLRLGEAGFTGVPAPGAVLHWRRWGFTRLTAATDRVGGLEGGVRAARPSLFAPARLDALKREWAPAISIIAGDGEALDLDGQVTCDAEIVPLDHPERASGQHVLLAPSAARLLADETLVDTLATTLDARPGLDVLALVGARGLRRPLPLGTPLTDGLLSGVGVDPRTVAAVALRRDGELGLELAGTRPGWAALVDAVIRHGARHPDAGAALAAPPAFDAVADPDFQVPVPPAPPVHWTAGLLASLPARTAAAAVAEPVPMPPSQLVRARVVRDRLGGQTLYDAEELPPDGLTLGSVEWELLRESVIGARPLLRTIDREGRRGLAVARPT
ncbi:MAG: glycosyltransferase family 2 protein, partial [Miltoncostaeaceae bacterium]